MDPDHRGGPPARAEPGHRLSVGRQREDPGSPESWGPLVRVPGVLRAPASSGHSRKKRIPPMSPLRTSSPSRRHRRVRTHRSRSRDSGLNRSNASRSHGSARRRPQTVIGTALTAAAARSGARRNGSRASVRGALDTPACRLLRPFWRSVPTQSVPRNGRRSSGARRPIASRRPCRKGGPRFGSGRPSLSPSPHPPFEAVQQPEHEVEDFALVPHTLRAPAPRLEHLPPLAGRPDRAVRGAVTTGTQRARLAPACPAPGAFVHLTHRVYEVAVIAPSGGARVQETLGRARSATASQSSIAHIASNLRHLSPPHTGHAGTRAT